MWCPPLCYTLGVKNENQISLTHKQATKLAYFLDAFFTRAQGSSAIPVPMLLLLGGVRQAVIDSDGLDQYQIDVILWSLDVVFAAMKEDEYDPQLEQLYHKLAGWWPINPPWYERIEQL